MRFYAERKPKCKRKPTARGSEKPDHCKSLGEVRLVRGAPRLKRLAITLTKKSSKSLFSLSSFGLPLSGADCPCSFLRPYGARHCAWALSVPNPPFAPFISSLRSGRPLYRAMQWSGTEQLRICYYHRSRPRSQHRNPAQMESKRNFIFLSFHLVLCFVSPSGLRRCPVCWLASAVCCCVRKRKRKQTTDNPLSDCRAFCRRVKSKPAKAGSFGTLDTPSKYPWG